MKKIEYTQPQTKGRFIHYDPTPEVRAYMRSWDYPEHMSAAEWFAKELGLDQQVVARVLLKYAKVQDERRCV